MSKKPSLPGAAALFGGSTPIEDKTPKSVEVKSSERKETSDKNVKKQAPIHVKKQTRIGAERSSRHEAPDASTNLQKYSLYFSPELLEKLEDTWYQLKKRRRGRSASRTTKWKIVNVILDAHLENLDEIEQLLEKTEGE